MWRSRRSSRMSSIRIWSPTGSTTYRSGWARRVTRPASPISAPANASAAARFPTPGGPWKRYACAGPSETAARRSRFASGCSGKLSNASMDLAGELGGRLRSVDDDDPVRKHRGELTVCAVDGARKVVALALDPVGRATATPCNLRVDEDEERRVRQEPTGRLQVQLEDPVDAEVARHPLVGKRRVDVAVADHVLPCLERGRDHPLDELGSCGHEERRLGPRRDVVRVEEQRSDLFAEVGAAGLA